MYQSLYPSMYLYNLFIFLLQSLIFLCVQIAIVLLSNKVPVTAMLNTLIYLFKLSLCVCIQHFLYIKCINILYYVEDIQC